MNIIPVSFGGEKHRQMLGNCKKWIDKGQVAIDPDLFPELLTELRIATICFEANYALRRKSIQTLY